MKPVVGLLITNLSSRLLPLYMEFRALKGQALHDLPLLFLLLLVLVRPSFSLYGSFYCFALCLILDVIC
jgi:hypothetical protein